MINLYHLKYFYDAVHAKSIAKAASQNRVSHPAVSQAIKSLESRLGVPLLIHAKRRFDVTPQGSILFKRAEALFQHLDETIHALIPENGVLRGPLAIGCSHSLGLSLGSKFFPDFCNENPEVDFSLRIGNSKSLEALLDSRTIEIGLGVDDGSFSHFEKRKIRKGRFVLIGKTSVKSSPSQTYLVGDKGFEIAQLKGFLRTREPKARFIEIQSWELIAQMAARGAGWGLIPDYLLDSGLFLKSKVLQTPYSLPSYELCAFFKSSTSLSRPAKTFLNDVSKN